MEERTPVVSVIMPVYNAARYVEEAVSSVVRQTMTDWELIIIDDCSPDDSFQIVPRAAADDPRIHLLQNEHNSGVSRTRNRGIELAKGAYIAFLDSDDAWYPEKLARQLAKMEAAGAQMSYCAYTIIGADGEKVKEDYLVPEQVTYEDLLKENCIQCSSMLIRADIVRCFPFTTEFFHEDYVMGLQLLRAGYKAVGCTEILSKWRYIENSRSFNKWKAAKNRWDIYRNFLKLPLGKSAYVFAHYAFAGLRKYSRKA